MARLLRYFFLFSLLFAIIAPHKAISDSNIDSLFQDLINYPIDTSSFNQLDEIIRQNLYNDPDLAIVQAKKVLALAREISRHDVITKMILDIGIAYDLKGQYDSALFKFDEALALAQQYNLKTLEGDIYNNFGIVYAYKGQLEKSLEYGLNALQIFESISDSSRLAKIYNNLGSRYSEMGINEKALEYYEKAVSINQSLDDKRRLSYNFGNIGTIYSDMGENEMALNYYTKAFYIQKNLDNQVALSISLGNIAISYLNLGQYELALDWAKQAYDISVEVDDEIGNLTYYITCAKVYYEKKYYDKSLENYKQAETIAVNIDARQNLLEIYKGMADLYAMVGEYQNAYAYTDKYNTERVSFLDSEKDKALSMVKQYEEIKRGNEIALLTKDSEIQKLKIKRQKILKNSVAGIGVLFLLLAVGLWHRIRYVRRTLNEMTSKNKIIQKEKKRSDDLLLNILPKQTAEELKTHGKSKARRFEQVTVLFSDFKGFTKIAETLSPEELVQEVDHCFKTFDEIISKYNIEKIKTIGDAYMCAGGLPIPNTTNPIDVVNAGLDIIECVEKLKKQRIEEGKPYFEARIGIHTGPVVAGIVGLKKFAYDIWGDTVNIASRIESCSETGHVNISEATYQYVKDNFDCKHRGKVEAKSKGAIDMYYANRITKT